MTRKALTLEVRAPGARTLVTDHAAEALVARLSEREHAPAAAPPPTDARIIPRRGRLRADGTRTGAREVSRLTVYLPPALARRLAVYAADVGRDRSEITAEALVAWFAARDAT